MNNMKSEKKKIEPRTWLTEGRERLGLDRKLFGMVCGANEVLVTWLEEGLTITHPNIAARCVRAIGGTVEQYNSMVHEMHRAKKLPKAPKLLGGEVLLPKKCKWCGVAFLGHNKKQQCCSLSCAGMYRYNKDKETSNG